MKKSYQFSIILFSTIIFLLQQQTIAQEVGREKLLKAELGFHGLGLGYELPLGNSYLAEFNFAVGGGLHVDNSKEITFTYTPGPALQFHTGARRYYSLTKRQEKGRKLALNSGNYFGAKVKYSSRGLTDGNSASTIIDIPWNTLNDVILSELHWGMQRNLGKRFIFNGHIGVGYYHDLTNKTGTINYTGGVKLGYKLL